MQMMNRVVNDILDNSVIVQSGEDIITEVSTIATIASSRDIVADTTTRVLVDEYLPRIFDAIDVLIVRGKTQPSVLYAIAQQSQELIHSLESTLRTNHTADNNHLAESLVEYATFVASTALAESSVREIFNFETTEYNGDGRIYNR
eukprot:37048_1